MTQQEIEIRNEQIARMIGGIYSKNAKAWGFGNARVEDKEATIQGKKYKDLVWAERFERELKFHSDWNWIMEAVEFIGSIGGSYSISNKSCAISVNEPYWFSTEIIVKTNEPALKAVFIAVSDFAKTINDKGL
jgi:hypothetical protein